MSAEIEALTSGTPRKLSAQTAIALAAAAATMLGILLVHPQSLLHFSYYFCVWNAFILFVNREDIGRFSFAFLVNSAFIAIYVLVQTAVYPDSYGTTSHLSITWTDDSYFFTLMADTVPPDLLTRPFYWLYNHTFASLIRNINPFTIEHPLDVLFFQSGTAALLSTFTRRFILQFAGTARLADIAYVFVLICPFLMMNGGVLLLRDTFAAALLIYSLCCINSRRYVLAAGVIALQVALRPGTGLILMPVYAIIYFDEIKAAVRRHPLLVASGAVVLSVAAYQFTPVILDLLEAQFGMKGVSFIGRELIDEMVADSNVNTLLVAIQEMPFLVRLFLNAAYIFLYPFLSIRQVIEADYFDLRNIAMSLVVPIYAFWLNAWFIGGAITSIRVIERQRAVIFALVATMLLIGSYSLQTRHKTVIYALYYIVVAIGFTSSTRFARNFGYAASGFLLLVEIAAALR